MAEKIDAEFHEGAVRIVAETGRPVAPAAKDLGINGTMLASWVSRARRAGGDGMLSVRSWPGCAGRTWRRIKRIEELEMERDVLKRCKVLWSLITPAALVGVISDQRTLHDIPHTVACRALGVSTAWFYKWRRRPAQPTKREVRRGSRPSSVPRVRPTARRGSRRTCGPRAGRCP